MTVPTDRHDGTDPGVERYLRDTFAGDAAHAPVPDDLVGAVHRIGHAHRRRTAVVSATLSVVLVAAGAAVAQRVTADARPAPLPATQAPTGTVDQTEPTLLFRGVEVPVPAEMLDPEAYPCGSAVKDAAYVIDDALPVRACSLMAAHPEQLTEVVLQQVSTVPEGERVAGATVLPDGRTRVASALPRANVWLSVTSPDADLANELFGGALLPDRINGCPIQPAEPFTDAPPEMFQTGAITRGGVCGYRAGWLVGATWLNPRDVQHLSELIEAAPSGATVDCSVGRTAPEGTGWWVTLPGERLYFDGSHPCPTFRGSTTDSGVLAHSGLLTDSIVSALWSLAPGPATLEGVSADK